MEVDIDILMISSHDVYKLRLWISECFDSIIYELMIIFADYKLP